MKQTEIGLIPDDWEVKRLNAICNNISSGKNQNRFVNGIYPVYGSTGIIGFCNNNKYSGDAILVARVGANAGLVNKVAGKYDVSDNTLVIQSDKCDIDYLSRLLAFRNLNQLIFGSGQPLITGGQLKALLIQLPSLTEQQRIAKALFDVDALISTTEKLIQKKKNIKQGTMQELLTGKKRLPGFAKSNNTKMTELGEIPEDWEVKSLGEICVINPASSNIIPDEFFYVDLESVSSGKLGKKQKIRRRNAPSRAQRQFEKNDILYQTVRPYQRNNLFVNFDSKNYIASTGYAIIRSNNNVDSHYIYQIIHLNNFVNIILDNCTGTSYPAINPKFLKTIPVIIPKKEEQAAIANVLSSMDKEIETLNTKLEKYRNLKNAMMQQLLTGKIRLV